MVLLPKSSDLCPAVSAGVIRCFSYSWLSQALSTVLIPVQCGLEPRERSLALRNVRVGEGIESEWVNVEPEGMRRRSALEPERRY